jgi:hypothetical protein
MCRSGLDSYTRTTNVAACAKLATVAIDLLNIEERIAGLVKDDANPSFACQPAERVAPNRNVQLQGRYFRPHFEKPVTKRAKSSHRVLVGPTRTESESIRARLLGLPKGPLVSSIVNISSNWISESLNDVPLQSDENSILVGEENMESNLDPDRDFGVPVIATQVGASTVRAEFLPDFDSSGVASVLVMRNV